MFSPVVVAWRYGMGLQKGLILLLVALPILSAIVLTSFFGDNYRKLVDDPAFYTNESSYLGLFSNLGVLCWWGGAVACGIAAAQPDLGHRDRVVAAYGAILSGWLCLDDLFLIHDGIPLHRIGIPEEVWFAGYVIAITVYIYRYRDVHARIGAQLLVWSLGLMATSVVVDVLHLEDGPFARAWVLVEEGSKFAGICCWAAYHVRIVHRLLGERSAVRSGLGAS